MNRILCLVSLLLPTVAIACGPWIPTPYTVRNDAVFFDAPRMGFMRELQQMLPSNPAFAAVLVEDQAPNASEALLAVLKAEGVPEVERTQILSTYQRFRQLLNDAKSYHDSPPYRSYQAANLPRDTVLAKLKGEYPPAMLPREFSLYLFGARAYYLGDIEQARDYWQALLELPIAERQHQSIRAAFMLAKTKPSPIAYRQVRELAMQGLDDPDGLAAASYGREAQFALKGGDYPRAVDLYLMQSATGYWNAANSLQRTAGKIWDVGDDSIFTSIVQFDNLRAVLTADLLSSYNSAETQNRRTRFVEALPSPKEITVAEAGRFALLEYQENNLSATRLWLSYASPRDALALWVQSKMLLRDGQIDEGRTLLIELLQNVNEDNPDWPRIETRHAWGELGLLMLKKGNYSEAANCFAKAESWFDLAYVIERVMSLEELQEWALMSAKNEFLDYGSPNTIIARRLMREGQFEAALPYFDTFSRQQAETYIHSMREASKAESPADIRARHYWRAASVMREDGLRLFGTELDPDYTWSGGSFDFPNVAERRQRSGVNQSSHDEERRVQASALETNQRFHYRYRATQLAELAAGLLPNNDENAARIYCIAGGWIKKRDPQAADRLYKQLVVRCPNTELGRTANRLHWFPPEGEIMREPFEG